MLNNIMIGRYYPIRSFVHKMNPISKIICTLLFVLMCAFATSLMLNLVLAGLVILMMFNTNVPIRYYIKTITSLRFILLFVIIINYIFNVYFEITLIMLLRIILIVLYTSILTLTTPPTEITYGLERVFSPLKIFRIPVNRMALSISIALRFIPTIIDQGNKILKAQASRGVDFYNSNLVGKTYAIKSLIIPMFILSMKRADDLADSMDVRLFSIYKKRTNFRINKWGLYDSYLVAIHAILLISIIARGALL